jgi:4-amino-4-deoxy-L-arabinose transferase-like glycosyltransferase
VVIAARCAALFGAGRFGRALAALTTACAPVIFTSVHVDNTTPLDLLFWATVVLCVATALLRGRPRWWLGAGVAAGLGLENDNLMLVLLAGIAIGVLVSPAHRQVLHTRWPWLAAAIAAVIWAPNLIWPAAAVLREPPAADHLPRALSRPERLDPAANRGVHRPRHRLAGAVAAAQTLRLSRQQHYG